MATSFSALPIISLSALLEPNHSSAALAELSSQLDKTFSTTGFAYLVDLPLSHNHDDIFGLCEDFFINSKYPDDEKRKLAKQTFFKENKNTYRGYFPPQPGSDNLKEGFEIGPSSALPKFTYKSSAKLNLTEGNVWPSDASFRQRCESLYDQLQTLASSLLSLLAVALGKDATFFDSYLSHSISTLRLLHYPAASRTSSQKIICTPHTDSGILTLLHQDPTGGLEVLNSSGEWIAAPYVPGSVVVNIGDLMARVSNGRYVATTHRVRATTEGAIAKKRFSVPFFFEPGPACVVRSIAGNDAGVVYGEHVLEKMSGWVEFQPVSEPAPVIQQTPELIAVN
ncbi:hypothetical protein BP6252_01550 [Coleophoma cylindrospora]|uniref:Fe2OG dioxygenase domain-containing protein n=1 Tax=Coleophoma cylindrospora TaxID=1849047 RepID=A0A3D8SUQ7_9HELO|nr:hypothetical protein BP6252_01550 [Coleophoma cylindrospora]